MSKGRSKPVSASVEGKVAGMGKITITKLELLELWNGLPLLGSMNGFKLGYAVARTRAKLRPEIEALDESLKPRQEFTMYETKRLELCMKYAEKDDQGVAIIVNDQFIFGPNQGKFDIEIAKLNTEYTKAIEARQRQVAEYNASLKEEIVVEVHQVVESDIQTDPEPTVAQMAVLYYLIV
jgi:hypothetical protein